MEEHEAVFEIDSTADAYAVERLLNQLYDTVREELRTQRQGSSDSTAVLQQFEALRDAAQDTTPGTLTVRYESRDEEFED
jgi:hypothetical protein